jgi:lysyl-tRNA synthetase class II
MSNNKNQKNQNPELANTSSNKAQRSLRISKMEALRKLGIDPFPIESKRDFELEFVRFWFDFTHKFLTEDRVRDGEIIDGEKTWDLNYFLREVLNPPTLVDIATIQIWNRQENYDFFEESQISKELTQEARSYFPDLSQYNLEELHLLIDRYLNIDKIDDEVDIAGAELAPVLQKNQRTTLAGRVKKVRVSGKIAFVILEDFSLESGFQVVLKKDKLDSLKSDLDAFSIVENETEILKSDPYKAKEMLVEMEQNEKTQSILDIIHEFNNENLIEKFKE